VPLRKKRSFFDKVRDFFWQEIDEDGNPIKHEKEHEEDIKIYGNDDNMSTDEHEDSFQSISDFEASDDNIDADVHEEHFDETVPDNIVSDNILDTEVHEELASAPEANKKNKLFVASVVVFTVFVLAFSGYLFAASWLGIANNGITIAGVLNGEDNIEKILIMGIDENHGGGRGRADTVMLAIINTTNPELKVVSIPRDTRMQLPRRGYDKINHAYAHGGVALLLETVNDFFDIEVEKYISLDFNSFIEVVDILGGMEYYVERRMFYPAEGIDLRPGMQMLDGNRALQYVRFRGATGDVGRVERQQRFIMEFIEQKLELRNVLRIPELVREINNNVETNLSITEMISMGMAMRDLETERIYMEMLPGEPRYIGGVSFWISSTRDLDDIFPQEDDEEEYDEPEETNDSSD